MRNPFKYLQNSPTGLIRNWLLVTPNDSEDNIADGNAIAIGLFIDNGGVIVFTDVDGNEVTVAVPDSFYLNCSVARVKNTGTTATGIFALISA
jgi:hypothetical protein